MNILNQALLFIKKYNYLVFMLISLIILDIATRYFTAGINFYDITNVVPNLFTILWILLIVGITFFLNKKTAIIYYIIVSSMYIAFFIVNNIYYSYFKVFFDFSSIGYASEASDYFMDAIKSADIWIYIVAIISLIFGILAIRSIPSNKQNNLKYIPVIILIFIFIHFFIPIGLGNATTEWSAWRNPRNVYISFNDNNRSMQVAGFFEYLYRNIYINYLRKEVIISDDVLSLLRSKFENNNEEYNTELTGIFKDKNLILLQLESIDDFLVTKEIMPTLYNMRNNAYNFNNHYSYVSGGGSTFNSEFMVNIGYTNPISYNLSSYTFSKNNFSYSLPNIFKDAGYEVNAFHMNNATYYSRGVSYKNFGYNNYYGLRDLNDGKYYNGNNDYWLDTELINNPIFNELLFDTEEKFVDYIITYSAHMPYGVDKGVCSLLVEDTEILLSELECLKLQAKETDNMIKLLLENLEEKGLLDDTIIVLFADHYLYTLKDDTILNNYKITENNLINKTPFLIWGNNIKKTNITEVTSQLNILPTILNLFGVEYHPNYYLADDALNKDYKGLVFFSDYSWFDGNVYVENGIVTNGEYISDEELALKNKQVNELIIINDSLLLSNYFKNVKKLEQEIK